MLGKHWIEVSHDEPEHNPEPKQPIEEEEANGSLVTP
jgi:hypothetical protein